MISPEQATKLLENGTPPLEVFARLDIGAIQMTPKINTTQKPLIETRFSGFGAATQGVLAFTIQEAETIRETGENYVFVCDGTDLDSDSRWGESVIVAHVAKPARIHDHLLPNLAQYHQSVLIDNPSSPQFHFRKEHGYLETMNGQTLSYGDRVTIDPVSGRIWDGLVSLSPAPNNSFLLPLMHSFNSLSERPVVAFHAQHEADMIERKKLYRPLLRSVGNTASEEQGLPICFESWPIGLYRSEYGVRSLLAANPSASLSSPSDLCVLFGGMLFPYSWGESLFRYHAGSEISYRLLDLSGFDLQDADQPKLKTSIYEVQLEQTISGLRDALLKSKNRDICPQTITVPAIQSVQEVVLFKRMFEKIRTQFMPPQKYNLLRFGVMVETKEALQNIAGIALLCDQLCIGGNDLTAALTGLSRHQFDHNDWMQERGYAGRSPFEVLVPEVINPLREGIAAARHANPKIKISFCGHQIAGHDPASTFSCLSLGVDTLVIPPTPEAVVRTQAVIVQNAARKALSL